MRFVRPSVPTQTTIFDDSVNEQSSVALIVDLSAGSIAPEFATYSTPSGRRSSNCQPPDAAFSEPVTDTVMSTISPGLTSVVLASKSNTKSGSSAANAASGMIPTSINTLKAIAKNFFI